MRVVLAGLMAWMLVRSAPAMDAAAEACALFVRSVLPGLYPYMTLSLMLVSRTARISPTLAVLLGWCGGSPTGARLLAMQRSPSRRAAVACATMSPMFLAGTLARWLNSPAAGACILLAVLAGGALASLAVRGGKSGGCEAAAEPLSFGAAVTSAAATMLMVCGTMVMLRVLAALCAALTSRILPALTLPLLTLLEVTAGAEQIAALPLPLALRAALLAGAAGFGGAAVLLQNRAALPPGLLTLPEQILLQALHGAASFFIALGLALLAGI